VEYQFRPAQSPIRYVPLLMTIKRLITALPILLTSTLMCQNLKVDTFKASVVDTGSMVRWQCHAGPGILSSDDYPLLIINDRIFRNCLLQNIYFDLDSTTISAVQVLNPKNDSVKLYGRAGKNGVIIIKTRKSIDWISARQILKQKANIIFSTRKKTLIKVGNVSFDANDQVYFQKDLIDNISVTNNTIQYFADKQFNSIVTITIAKKSGT